MLGKNLFLSILLQLDHDPNSGKANSMRRHGDPEHRLVVSLFQCYGSGMFFPDPGSWFLSIPDPTTAPKEEGERFFGPTIFCSQKYHDFVNNFIFEQIKKILLAKTLRIISTYPPKICHWPKKIWVWGPRSGKSYFGSRVKKAPNPGSAPLVDLTLNYPNAPGETEQNCTPTQWADMGIRNTCFKVLSWFNALE